MGPFIFKAGVLDYQTFAKNLQVLEGWITEAEEILKGQDPSHSSDLSEIQSRMEELKVTTKCRKCNLGGFFGGCFCCCCFSGSLAIFSTGYAQISYMHSLCVEGLSCMQIIRLRT